MNMHTWRWHFALVLPECVGNHTGVPPLMTAIARKFEDLIVSVYFVYYIY